MNSSKFNLHLSRRSFLRSTAFAAACSLAPTIAPRALAAGSPNERLNLGFIGIGGRGRDNLVGLRGENVVALCDVDESRAAQSLGEFPKAKVFRDFRVMLDKVGGELDGVVVSTPDHTHAPAVMQAIGLGKHVYCEKPLAHSLHEVRTITEAARAKGIATQLGNQGHSTDSIRQFVEMIHGGAIGTIGEVHAWCSNSYRPRGFKVRPSDTPPVPAGLDWDLWLGPASNRPYHPAYLPGKWRGWVDFGTGIIGDWVCHVVDPVFWALDLGSPTTVTAHAEDYDDPKVRAETYPAQARIQFDFPERNGRPPVKLHWYTGCRPDRPPELEPGRDLVNIGAIVVGDQGKIMYGSHGAAGAQLLPAARNNAYIRPPRTLPRSGGHYEDWVAASKGGPPASSNFNYGGSLTEIAVLGVLAMQLNGRSLQWDATALEVTNDPEAQRLIKPFYREGWTL
jgi:predicted dehydrogenase